LLTSFLQQNYDITSIEPGGFTGFTDELRNKILNQHKLKAHTTTVENFTTDTKFDFIFFTVRPEAVMSDKVTELQDNSPALYVRK
jgi:hypothetical protein